MAHNSASSVIASYSYTLGATGNRTRIDEGTGISRVYTYDNLYRLAKEQVTDPAATQTYTTDYAYDSVGNRLNKTHTTAADQPLVSTDYSYNAADQLITENGVTYSYDLNGNLASKTNSSGTTIYSYNYDDRLVRVMTPTQTLTYAYDVDGNRIETTGPEGTTRYLVDANRGLSQIVAEYKTDGAITASYVYADDLISMARNSDTHWYLFDGLGSTRLLTADNGTVTDTYDYDAFGNLLARTGSTDNAFLFTGQRFDGNTGFYHLRARYYQLSAGRFTSLDPWEGDAYAPVTLHKYLYVDNDPLNKIDPNGRNSLSLAESAATISLGQTLTVIAIPTITALAVLEPPIRLYRYTSKAKVAQAQSTGFVFGDLGVTWWTTSFYLSAAEAKSKLSLMYPPEAWLSVLIYRTRDLLFGPLPVEELFGEKGGGVEFWSFKPIPFWSRSPDWGFIY